MSKSFIKNVGTANPLLKTSPIITENDKNVDAITQDKMEIPVCYFNSLSYPYNGYVRSGNGELLRCRYGMWLRITDDDTDNII